MGFKVNYVSKEESGSTAYYYYTWDFNVERQFGLISSESDNLNDGVWTVYIAEVNDVIFTSREDVEQLINLLRKNKIPVVQ